MAQVDFDILTDNIVKRAIKKYIDNIDNNDFIDVYEALPTTVRGDLTQILHSVGIYPELHLTNLPVAFDKHNDDTVEVILPSTVKCIGGDAFNDCFNLRKLYLGAVEVIGKRAFYDCPSLRNVVIPKTVMIIGSRAFADTGIEHLHYEGTMEEFADIEVHKNAFEGIHTTDIICKDGKVIL